MKLDTLSDDQCRALLDRCKVARLACVHDGQPYVVPITYAYDGNAIYAFSMPGQKVDWMRENPKVCLIVEEHGDGGDWESAVVYGSFEELPDRIAHNIARDRAWHLLSKRASWWEPGDMKPEGQPVADHSPHLFFQVRVTGLSGRQCSQSNEKMRATPDNDRSS